MKQKRRNKPKFNIHDVDWESVFIFLVAVAVGIVLMVMLTSRIVKADEHRASASTASSSADETRWTPPAEFSEPEVVAEPIPRIHIGRCRLTIYTPYETHHGYNTATGVKAQHLMTCAVDPRLIPYGSNVILIKPDGTEHRLKAIDCGNFKGHMVDVFFDGTVTSGVGWLADTFGEEYADVWIETPEAQRVSL